MEVVAQMIQLLNFVVGVMLIVAILRLFAISSTLNKILKKLDKMDQNRRDEFNAMTEAQS